MRTYRLALFVPIAVAALLVASCGNNNSAKTEAPVFLAVSAIPQGVADVPMSSSADVAIPNMSISSKSKSPTGVLSGQDDAILSEWVVTCTRTDGGTVASPVWHNYNQTIYVPAGGSAPLQNFRIFPAEYFHLAPLYQLYPENGGYDPETNNTNIRERLHIEIFGKTVAGKSVSVAFDVNLNFFY
jgi:hypothetical protein